MRPSPPDRRSLRDESGSAALEFLTAGVILLVPLVYLGLALSAAQGAALAAEGAAREAARVYVSAASDAVGRASADRAVTVALADRRIARRPGDLSLVCDGEASECLQTGHRMTATVRIELEPPFVPSVFGLDRMVRVPIRASASAPVFRLGETP